MYRTIAAAALAAVILPAAAIEASAAPTTLFGKTYTLACTPDAMDGEALRVRMILKNTSGHIIKKGSKITITFVYGYAPGNRPRGPKTTTVIAYRDVLPNASIGFDERPRYAHPRGCRASVTIGPNLDAVIKKNATIKKVR